MALVPRLRAALEQLNQGVPADAISLAIEERNKGNLGMERSGRMNREREHGARNPSSNLPAGTK